MCLFFLAEACEKYVCSFFMGGWMDRYMYIHKRDGTMCPSLLMKFWKQAENDWDDVNVTELV